MTDSEFQSAYNLNILNGESAPMIGIQFLSAGKHLQSLLLRPVVK